MGSSSIKPSVAFATIRRIATLGYPGELVLPPLLAAIRDVVPYDKAMFAWMDEEYNAVDWHGPPAVPAEAFLHYLEQYYNQLENEVIPSNHQLMTTLGVDRSAVIPKFHQSDFFNVVFRSGDNAHYLRVAIRNGTQPVGVFYLLRTGGSRNFTGEDEACLRRVKPWITHALAASPGMAAAEKLTEDGSGLIIADREGGALFCTPEARDLLHRAMGVPVDLRTLSDMGLEWSRKLIENLARELVAARINKGGALPARCFQNHFGFFQVRAYWLDSVFPGAHGNIAIQIQRQIPLPVKLMQSPKVRALPPREQQACLLLAQGLSSTEIARKMDISPNGAIRHIRSLYERLGISRREELVSTLLAQ